MNETNRNPAATVDWRRIALSMRQAGSLLRALGGTTLANALQRPQTHRRRGQVTLRGLDATVEIIRDGHDIPHCYAESAADAMFALGYVQAQDRLWQMHWNRRAAQGRLAEIVGPLALPADRFARTLGIARVAEDAWSQTPKAQQRQLDPFIAGINASIARAPRPFEAQMLEEWIFPWQASDSIAWGKLLSILLSPAWEQQLIRARIAQSHGLETLAAIDYREDPSTAIAMPPGAPYGDVVVEKADTIHRAAQRMSDLLGLQRGASNNWAVDGRHTETGAPLFACDPHLNPVTPPHAYFAHLHCPEFNAAGASVPGLPGLVWGFNDHIAWGPTAAMMSMNLAVVEQLSDDGVQSLTPDGWVDLSARQETIRVRGYEAEPLTVQETVHGPIVSDIAPSEMERLGGDARAISLHSSILSPSHAGGGIADLLSARNWDDFSEAASEMADFNLCFAYADRQQVGMRVSGRVPQGDAAELRLPVAGWQAPEHGGVPTMTRSGNDLPHIVNPPQGVVVSANAALTPAADSEVGAEFLDPARAQRIRELLGQRAAHTPDTFAAIQTDRVSLPLRDFARRLPDDEFAEWDGDMAPASVEAAIVAATLIEYRRAELSRLLGDDGFQALEPMLAIPTLDIFAARATRWAIARIDADPKSAQPRLRAARERAERVLRRQFGSERSAWTWGRCRQLSLSHSLADAPLIGPLLSPGPFAYGGEVDTVSQSGVLGLRHFARATAIPSLRLIVQLSDDPQAWFALSGEQIHDPLHANGPLTDAWLHGRTLPLLRDRSAVEASAAATRTRRAQRLLLQPEASVD